MDDTQLAELIKALMRLSHAVNDLSQELLDDLALMRVLYLTRM